MSLEVKLPTIWTDGTAEVGRVWEEKRRRTNIREEKESEERRCRCGKRWKSCETLCFSKVLWSGGSKWRCGAIWSDEDERWKSARFYRAKHTSKLKMLKTPHARSTFGSWCRKSARPCGAKHIWKWTCCKHRGFGALFVSWDVQIRLDQIRLDQIRLDQIRLG